MKLDKYRGVIPAFYACYDGDGAVSRDAARRLTRYFVEQGVKGMMISTRTSTSASTLKSTE